MRSVEQAGPTAIEDAVAIANYGANRGARAGESSLADTRGSGAKVRVRVLVGRPCLQLIGSRELLHGDFVLIGVTGPCAVHQRHGFVFLVFFKDGQGACVEFGIFAAGE
jgi:hypothetical protein